MNILKDKTGNYLNIKGTKTYLNENELLLVENFWYHTDAEDNTSSPYDADDQDRINEIKSGKYIVRIAQSPNGEVKALYRNNDELIGAKIGDKFVSAEVKGLKEACYNTFGI